MPTIVYLDVEDEITSAASRMRGSNEGKVALVVPNGSRVATSRINFRLLAREAQVHGRDLAVIAADGATRALAASAGLPVFASVGEYEEVLAAPAGTQAAPDRPAPGSLPAAAAATATRVVAPERHAEAPAPAAPAAELEQTAVYTPVAADRARPGPEATKSGSIPVVGRPRSRPRRVLVLAIAAVAALALLVGGVAAYVFLPSAEFVLTPREEPFGPLQFEVRADPEATGADPAAGVVPAERLTFELSADGSFPATGRRVEETRATGQVTFENYDFTSANTIPAGSVVATEGGVQFRTVAAITLPAAQLVIPQVIPTERSVAVEAVQAGPGGNVAANTIRAVPRGENPTYTRVTNREATAGGARQEFPQVAQQDVDAAVEQLTQQLRDRFAERLADPSEVPDGMTVFPQTQAIAEATPSEDPAAVVGREVSTFELTLTTTGTVIAVDEDPVRTVADARIRGSVGEGYQLLEDSVRVVVGEPAVEGETVFFPVTARADRVRVLDRDALLEQIKGRSIGQARTILEPYGTVEVKVWPDWVTSVPTIDGRVSLSIAGVDDAASSSPSEPGASALPASPSP